MDDERQRRLKTLVFGTLSTAIGIATAVATVMLALRLKEGDGIDLLAHPRFALTAWIFPAYAMVLLAIGYSLLRHHRLERWHLVVVGSVIVATGLAVLLVGDALRALVHLALGAIVVWQLRGFLPRRD
jgi:uncharacterized BrkB/YihY/UPF0761 family membrane protein